MIPKTNVPDLKHADEVLRHALVLDKPAEFMRKKDDSASAGSPIYLNRV